MCVLSNSVIESICGLNLKRKLASLDMHCEGKKTKMTIKRVSATMKILNSIKGLVLWYFSCLSMGLEKGFCPHALANFRSV